MFDVKALNDTAWLVEPTWMRRAIARIASIPQCPTARELVEERRKRLDITKNAATTPLRGVKGKIGVIPVYGPIDQRVTPEMLKLGGTSTEEISATLDVFLKDKSVDAILMEFDSPGGSSYGIQELSDKIYAARDTKRIFGIANSLAASAAYWVASAVSHLSATPGADIGSVGVFAVHVDESKALESEGVTVSLVTAGKYKAEYLPIRPLTEDARGYLQMQVDVTYSKFLNALKRNRNTSLDDVRKNYGQGRVMNAEQAKAAGMIDRIATMEEVLKSLMGTAGNGDSRKASLQMLRMRHEQQKRLIA